MLDFLAQACRNFGSIILEVPSHLLASYPAQIAGYIDGVLLVAESGRTPAASLKVTVERFNEAAIKIIGIVLSQRAQAAQTSKGSRLMAQGAGSLAVWRQDGLPKIKDLSPGMQNAAENAAKLMQKANVFIRQR